MQPDVWTASTLVDAHADAVLEALTDPDLIAAWAPVGFDHDGPPGERLHAGERARVRGTLAGVGASFDVEVVRADEDALELLACGPIAFDVEYHFDETDTGTYVDARVALDARPGLSGRLLRGATAALLRRGALEASLRRLGSAVGTPERDLIAA